MKQVMRNLVIVTIIFSTIVSMMLPAKTVIGASQQLSEEAKNAITMLNYITVLSQEINSAKNNRLLLDDASSSVRNNTFPNAIDESTLEQLNSMLDTMEQYKMISVKRDRVQFIFEQNQAQEIRNACPSVVDLINPAKPVKITDFIFPVVQMAVNSSDSYINTYSDYGLEYIQDGWELDDAEEGVLYNSQKDLFNYMVKMVKEYDLPGDLTLTENTVDEFVEWKNNENVEARIQFLESDSSRKTYQMYGEYWLTLAESYYSKGDYSKCLEAIDSYESVNSRIFRKNYAFARVLPLAIASAKETLNDTEYTTYVEKYSQVILDNTENKDWAIRYFVAQSQIDLYDITGDQKYLQKAYTITADNVNHLAVKQQDLNKQYLSPVEEVSINKGDSKSVKEQVKKYNKMLEEERKTELPPVFEPLQLNCDLLFALAEKLSISDSEKQRLDSILHPSGSPLFLTQALDQEYWFINSNSEDSSGENEIVIEYGGNGMILPVSDLTDRTQITVSIKENGSGKETTITDWTVEKVARDKKHQDDMSTIEAAFSSAKAKKYSWKEGEQISIDIKPTDSIDIPEYHYEFKTNSSKKNWKDYLQVWKGHKNNWYDYVKVWENSVEFERVE